MSNNRSPLLNEVLKYCTDRKTTLNDIPPEDIIRIFQTIPRAELTPAARSIIEEDIHSLVNAANDKVINKLPITDDNMAEIIKAFLPALRNVARRIHDALNDTSFTEWKNGIAADKMIAIMNDLSKGYTFIVARRFYEFYCVKHHIKLDTNISNLMKLLTCVSKEALDLLLQNQAPEAQLYIDRLRNIAEDDFILQNTLKNLSQPASAAASQSTTPRLTTPSLTPRTAQAQTHTMLLAALDGLAPKLALMQTEKTIEDMVTTLHHSSASLSPHDRNALIDTLAEHIRSLEVSVTTNTQKSELLAQFSALLMLAQANPHDHDLAKLINPISDAMLSFITALDNAVAPETLSIETQRDIQFLSRSLRMTTKILESANTLLHIEDNAIHRLMTGIAAIENQIEFNKKFSALRESKRQYTLLHSDSAPNPISRSPRAFLTPQISLPNNITSIAHQKNGESPRKPSGKK